MRTRLRYCLAVLVGLALTLPPVSRAQERGSQAPASLGDKWEFFIAPYFLFPHMNGSVSLLGINADVDADPGDILSKLKFGIMLLGEAHNGVWAVAFDGLYMNLGEDATNITASVGMDQGMAQFTGFRRVVPWLEVLVGGRYNTLGGDIEITFPNGSTQKVEQSKGWIDPFLGARVEVPAGSRWLFLVRGDIGGFGLGSELAWQIYPIALFRISGLLSAAAGYRVLYMDYETGTGIARFKYDVTTFGPEIGIGFTF